MHARFTTIEADPAKIDEMVASFEENDLPEISALDGFKGFTMVVDRRGGKCVGVSFWSSAEAMSASEEKVKASRERAADTGGAPAPQVEHFEVALDVTN